MTKQSKDAENRTRALEQLSVLLSNPALNKFKDTISEIIGIVEKLGPTPFSEWLRKQPELDSEWYNTSDIDFMWSKRKSNSHWVLIEEKCYERMCSQSQRILFDRLDKVCRSDPDYQGFIYIKFENTSPDDGKIYLNSKLISREQFINFLRFLPYTYAEE